MKPLPHSPTISVELVGSVAEDIHSDTQFVGSVAKDISQRHVSACCICGPLIGSGALFLVQRLKGNMSSDARDFNYIEPRVVINFFFPARQGAEQNSRHS